MVLVVFVIMLLNMDEDRPMTRLKHLVSDRRNFGRGFAGTDIFHFLCRYENTTNAGCQNDETIGKTLSIGSAMYTEYLLPVEIVGILLLMAIVGSVILARRLRSP